jgi:hypothetical protein
MVFCDSGSEQGRAGGVAGADVAPVRVRGDDRTVGRLRIATPVLGPLLAKGCVRVE